MYTTARRLAALQNDDMLVQSDMVAAINLLQRCILEHNQIGAMFDLATILANKHFGGSKTFLRMTLYDRCVIEGDHNESKLQLARLLQRKDLGRLNKFIRAVELYESYIERTAQGDAMYELAEILANGAPGVRRNSIRALQLFQRCVNEHNNIAAIPKAVQIIMSGVDGIEKDVTRAMQMCNTFIDAGKKLTGLTQLATKLAFEKQYPSRLSNNASFAVQLLELCIEKKDDASARVALAKILVLGRAQFNCGVDRGLQLCATVLETGDNASWSGVERIAQSLASAQNRTSDEASIAVRLCQMCIEKNRGKIATLILAGLSMTTVPRVESDVERALLFYVNSLRSDTSGVRLRNYARRIVGSHCRTRDLQLAIQLCEMCIERNDNANDVVALAEVLLTPVPGFENDVNRVLELCEKYVYRFRRCSRISCLAKNVAYGTSYSICNAPLSRQLCEMCMRLSNEVEPVLILAELLITGAPGVRKDEKRAIELYKCAFDAGASFNLAEKLVMMVASGTRSVMKNIPLAIELCEMYVAADDHYAMVMLGGILLAEGNGEEDISRGLQMCNKSLRKIEGQFRLFSDVAALARRMMFVERGVAKSERLALQLCEMCIASWKEWQVDEDVLVSVAQLLIGGTAHSKDSDFVIYLCEVACERSDSCCRKIASIARDIAFGTGGMVRDTALAIKLCEMCIDKNSNAIACITLAEIYFSRASKSGEDIAHGIKLCERSVIENREESLVVCLAGRVWAGVERMDEDKMLAVQLLQICIAKGGDVHAMVVLSEMYCEGGRGVPVDMNRAQDLYERAVSAGWLFRGIAEPCMYE